MDRELVLAILSSLLCGGALMACAPWATDLPDPVNAISAERQAWRRLWLPFVPALLVLGALAGWAINEPAAAERVPNGLLWAAVPFGLLFFRAGLQVIRGLCPKRYELSAATVGLFRPRIVISPRIMESLDATGLRAVVEHEKAHARHFDPLRLWLAQLATVMLWPWPAPVARLVCWKRMLELARDEEARRHGVPGPDLAAAILTSLRLNSTPQRASATLGGDQAFVQQRIARLLRPLDAAAPVKHSSWLRLGAFALIVGLAIVAGNTFGEQVVRALFAFA